MPAARHADGGEVLLVGLDRGRPLRLAEELVDGRQQQPFAAGELLRVVAPALHVDDRHQVVRAQLLLDELAHDAPDHQRMRGLDVQIVEHDDVDAAVEGARVGLDVGLDRLRREERPLDALDRDVDQGKGADRLRLASSKTWKSSFFRSRTNRPCWSVTNGVDLDVVDLELEGRRIYGLAAAADSARPSRRRLRPTGRRPLPFACVGSWELSSASWNAQRRAGTALSIIRAHASARIRPRLHWIAHAPGARTADSRGCPSAILEPCPRESRRRRLTSRPSRRRWRLTASTAGCSTIFADSTRSPPR